ncbi:MAG: AtpZ/AtpI family protein [Patescibacteria group bacterium]|nr:AtpZ/AtpI family protein [Patescibacteria group bacterium]
MNKKIVFLKVSKEFELKKIKEEFGKKKQIKKKNFFPLDFFLVSGYYIITPLILGVFLGLSLEKRFYTEGKLTTIFILLGGVGSIYNLFRLTKKK